MRAVHKETELFFNLLLYLKFNQTCHLQSTPLHFWYTPPNVFSVSGTRPGTCFAGRCEGSVFNFLLSSLPSEIGDLLVRISSSGTRKGPQGPNLESRAAGGQQSSHASSKIHGYGVMREQTQHKFCGNTIHLPFFSQNQVARTFTDSYFFGNFTDSYVIILTNHSKHFLNVIIIHWRGRPSRFGVVFDACSARFETLVPLVTLRMAQTVLSISLLQHLKSLCKSFSLFETEFDANALHLKILHLSTCKNLPRVLNTHTHSSACNLMTNWHGIMLLVSEWSHHCWLAISQVRFLYGLPTYMNVFCHRIFGVSHAC